MFFAVVIYQIILLVAVAEYINWPTTTVCIVVSTTRSNSHDFSSSAWPLSFSSQVRFGSFLFDNKTDLCSLSKICDPRQV